MGMVTQNPQAAPATFDVFLLVAFSLRHTFDEACAEFPMFRVEQVKRLFRQSATTRWGMLEAMSKPRTVRRDGSPMLLVLRAKPF